MDDDPIAVGMPRPALPNDETADQPKEAKCDLFYKFWDKFTKKKSLKLTPSIDRDEEGLPSHHPEKNEEGIVTNQCATTSYEEAAATCKGKVDAIVAECRRLNVKYYDPLFDLAEDKYDCLVSLSPSEIPDSAKGLTAVGAVKRVEDIFESPKFYIDGINANDVRQGYVGDCWFLAAITALSGKPELLEKVCVARDEKVGVYGFVFYRDCEWISVVVDDRLFLKRGDDNMQYPTEYMINVPGDMPMSSVDLFPGRYYLSKLPKEFRESLRKGSNALYFSSCRESNETWLPLLEKAYAKAHGDYQAIDGGCTGEGIEDLTGGVAISMPSEDILDKDQLWSELMQVNSKFLFGCSSRRGRDSDPNDDEGFVRGHAYTVLEAREIKYKDKDLRLLKIRNPWGNQEWNGAWSDGSKEWTAETMKDLNHTFGDDGIFWISYQDFLKYYPYIDRIRLFGPEWTVTQQWTCVEVPWTSDYLSTKFTLSIRKKSPVVLVLSQPDDRYFQGLTGRHNYNLHFRLYKDGQKTYMLRSMAGSGSGRSCNAELELDKGTYTILIKITARRDDEEKTAEEVIKENREKRRAKLLSVGRSFDLTHSKGRLREVEAAMVDREKKEAKAKAKAQLVAGRNKRKRQRERDRRKAERIEAEKERKKAAKKAEKAKKENGSADTEPKPEDEANVKGDEGEDDEDEKINASIGAQKSIEPAKEKPEKDEKRPAQPEVVIPAPEPVEEVSSTKEQPSPVAAQKSPPTTHTRTGSHPTAGSGKHPESAAAQPAAQATPSAEAESSTVAAGKTTEEKKDEKGPSTEDSKDNEENKPMDKKEMATELREIATQLEAEDDDNISISSVEDDDFDWDSDIDGSESSDSEEDDDKDEMYADDPWRAICVVGLKVFHVDAEVELGVTHKQT